MKIPLKLSSWCYRVVTLPVVIAAVVIFAFFIIVVLPQMAGQLAAISGVDISPDTSFIYTARELYAMAEAYGPEGRDYYIYSRFTFDLIWPAAYLFFLAATITYLFRFLPEKSPWRLVNLLPFAGTLFDLLENSAASLVMFRYPAETAVVAHLAPLFTFLKWLFIALSFAALVTGVVLQCKNLNVGRKKQYFKT